MQVILARGALPEAAGAHMGDTVTFEMMCVEQQEPEPEMPTDLCEALNGSPPARSVWVATTLSH